MELIDEFIAEQTADVGSRLKEVAERVMRSAFFIGLIIAVLEVLGGLITWIAVGEWTGFLIFAGSIVAAVIEMLALFFAAYIAMLCLYAKGESVHMLQSIAEGNKTSQPEIGSNTEPSKANYAKPEKVKPVIPKGVPTWKCQCGNVNPMYMSTCSCGLSKREMMLRQAAKDTEAQNGCPMCQVAKRAGLRKCSDCGAVFEQ